MHRVCPTCFKLWAAREARRATALVIAKYRINQGPKDRLVHAVVSFRGEPENIWQYRGRANKAFKRHGLGGYAMVPHHVRGKDDHWLEDGTFHYHAVGVVGPDGFRTVPDVIEDDFTFYDLVHGRGPRMVARGKVTGEYNYTFKVLRQGNRGRRNGYTYYLAEGQIYKRIFYNLAHASIGKGRHALTWGGAWFTPDQDDRLAAAMGILEGDGAQCPVCESNDTTILGEIVDLREYERQQRRKDRSDKHKNTAHAGNGLAVPDYVPPWKRKKR